eukprot:c27559_g1_i1 orf=246-1388(-)
MWSHSRHTHRENMGFFPSNKSRPLKRRDSAIQKLLETTKVVIVLCSLTLFPLLIAHTYPSILFIFLEVTPGFLRSVRNFLTPLYLFPLLNMIIIFVAITSYRHEGVKGSGDTSARVQKSDESVCVKEISRKMTLCSSEEGGNVTVKDSDSLCHTNEPIVILSESVEDSRDGSYIVKESLEQVPLFSGGDDREQSVGSHEDNPVPQEVLALECGNDEGEPSEVSVSGECNQLVKNKGLPLPSTRFTHRKYVRGNSEVKPLGISRQVKKAETLEATWISICEGRHSPSTRSLRKSESWNSSTPSLSKIETFKAGSAAPPLSRQDEAGMGSTFRIPRREPSMSQEELNRKVEEFISNFNEQIRLQRQESLLRYMPTMDKESLA